MSNQAPWPLRIAIALLVWLIGIAPAISAERTSALAPALGPAPAPQVQPRMLDSTPGNPANARGPASTQSVTDQRVPKWELPAITVVGESRLKSDQFVGSYSQPRWTVDRRFPGVRTYVIPEGTAEFEYWMRSDIGRKGTPRFQNQFELEFGLPYRFQLDLYGIQRSEDHETFFDTQVELRWALADWGTIVWNPTLYLEYASREDDADKVEVKLLLADQFGDGWHWGQNLLYEAEISGGREWEYGWTGGISKTIVDTRFDVGAEAQLSFFDEAGSRGSYTYEAFLGPSFQYRPTTRTHMNFAPLFGIGGESPVAKIFFNFGYEF